MTRNDKKYVELEVLVTIFCTAYFGALVIEFLCLMLGYSVMYKKVNTVQVLLHGLGVIGAVWQILEGWHYSLLMAMVIPFGLVPLCMEIGVMFSVRKFRKIEQHIEAQLKEEIDYRKQLEARYEADRNPKPVAEIQPRNGAQAADPQVAAPAPIENNNANPAPAQA